MNPIIQSTIAMLAVINPVVCGTLVMQLAGSRSKQERIVAGIKAMAVVLLILLGAALAGKTVLDLFGISMEAFHVVGGIILAFIGFQLLAGKTSEDTADSGTKGMATLILFAASPGTISMVITLSVTNGEASFPLNTMLGIIIAVLVSIGIMTGLQLVPTGKSSKRRGIFSRFMGLIIVAMGLQFLLDGLKDFF